MSESGRNTVIEDGVCTVYGKRNVKSRKLTTSAGRLQRALFVRVGTEMQVKAYHANDII